VVQVAFSPSAADVAAAMRLMTAYTQHQRQGQGAFIFEGKMIDAPTVLQVRMRAVPSCWQQTLWLRMLARFCRLAVSSLVVTHMSACYVDVSIPCPEAAMLRLGPVVPHTTNCHTAWLAACCCGGAAGAQRVGTS
jgi:hypothetical protein